MVSGTVFGLHVLSNNCAESSEWLSQSDSVLTNTDLIELNATEAQWNFHRSVQSAINLIRFSRGLI
jgi:hypothetical protein